MKINLKLYATLAEYLPAEAVANTVTVDCPPGETAYGLIDRYQVPRARAHLVLLNGVYVPPQQRAAPILKEGDTLAVWPPVAGG